MSACWSVAQKTIVLPGSDGSICFASSLADDAVEALGDDPRVELLDLDVDLVVEERELDRVGGGLVDLDLLAHLPDDPVLCEGRDDANRRLVVDQPAVDHGLPVAVLEDGLRRRSRPCAAPGWR